MANTIQTYTAAPDQLQIPSSLDLIAELINIHRLPGESLASFKLRVLDVYYHPANATYGGLFNGISRELGVGSYSGGVVLDVARDSDLLPDATKLDSFCRASVSSRYLTLSPYGLGEAGEVQFDLHDRGDSYFLSDLMSNINNDPTIPFEITTWGTAGSWDKSRYLKRLSSLQIENLSLAGDRIHTLYDSIPNGGGWIQDVKPHPDSGLTGLSSMSPSTSPAAVPGSLAYNEYWIPNFSRSIYTGSFANGTMYVQWQKFPMVIPMGQIRIAELRDNEYLGLITEDQPSVNGYVQNGIPNVEGADYVNELLAVVPMYYGK